MFSFTRNRLRLGVAAGAVVLACAASLTFAAASAHGTGGQAVANSEVVEDLALRQANDLPITALQFSRGSCRGIPEGDDGWHFVFPDGVFVSLTAHFLVDGEVITKGPAVLDGKHAYVASPAGAKLVRATALGIFNSPGSPGNEETFNLSHTCPVASPVEPTEEPTECCPCTEGPSINVTTEPGTEEPTIPAPTTTPPTGTEEPTMPVTTPASPGQPAPTAAPAPSPVSTCFSVTG